MIKQTKIGLEIDVKAYLKEVKGFYYVILFLLQIGIDQFPGCLCSVT